MNIVTVHTIGSRLPKDSPLSVVAVNPGFCNSDLAREASGSKAIEMAVMKATVGRTIEQGSITLVHGAIGGTDGNLRRTPSKRWKVTTEGVNGGRPLNGRYLNMCALSEESDWFFTDVGKETEGRLWVSIFLQAKSF